MATMNKPAYEAVQTHSPTKLVLIFVSSRRQTRLTALDIITFAVAVERPEQFLHMNQDELQDVLDVVKAMTCGIIFNSLDKFETIFA